MRHMVEIGGGGEGGERGGSGGGERQAVRLAVASQCGSKYENGCSSCALA